MIKMNSIQKRVSAVRTLLRIVLLFFILRIQSSIFRISDFRQTRFSVKYHIQVFIFHLLSYDAIIIRLLSYDAVFFRLISYAAFLFI